jgi:hypothetical protein
MAGGFELLIVVDAKGKTVFEVGFDLIPSGEIQTIVCRKCAHLAANCFMRRYQASDFDH